LVAWRLYPQSKAERKRPISIESEPVANLMINGTQLGSTPFYSEDLYVADPVDIVLTAPGYKIWRERFGPDSFVIVKARLERLPYDPNLVKSARAAQLRADQESARRMGGSLDDGGNFVDDDLLQEESASQPGVRHVLRPPPDQR